MEKKYILTSGFIIFFILISSASAFEFSQLQWAQGISGKLLRGEVITYKDTGGYSVEVVGFPSPVESDKYNPLPSEPVEPYVGLNISKNGSFIDTIALRQGESYITPDGELQVVAKQLPSKNAMEWLFESYAPWAIVELNPRGTPSLAVSIETDDRYISSPATDFVATVKLENTGSAKAVNVDISIVTELPIKRGDLKYHYDVINKGDSKTETITFSSPVLSEQKTYSIVANVSGYDVKNIFYTARLQKNITVVPEPQGGVSIRKTAVYKMYLKDYTLISLSVKNNGRYDLKNVSIIDALPNSFKLMGNNSLHWIVDIPANGEWDYRYLVRPQEPNKEGIVFPPATAEFRIKNEYYSIKSNQPKIVVYGAKVVLKKQTNVAEVNPGETVTVTLVAENTGNTPTKVVIVDKLPKEASIVSGSMWHEAFLEANKKTSFNYTLKIYKQTRLPPATADYYELGNKGRNISVSSEEIEIRIKSAIETHPTPAPQITTLTPTPVVEPLYNATNSNATNVEPKHNSANSSASNKYDLKEIFTFLNHILGCDRNGDNAPACKLFQIEK